MKCLIFYTWLFMIWIFQISTKISETSSVSVLPKYDLIAGCNKGIWLLKFFVVTFLLFTSFSFAQTSIMRASFSTAAKTANIGGFTVQQSIGHMGPMHTSRDSGNTVISGFLIPQDVAQNSHSADPELSITWSLYPNPFSTHINIDFSSPVSGAMQLMLFDAAGKMMIEKTLEAKQQQRISLEHLAEGAYMISISVLEKSFSTQILKY